MTPLPSCTMCSHCAAVAREVSQQHSIVHDDIAHLSSGKKPCHSTVDILRHTATNVQPGAPGVCNPWKSSASARLLAVLEHQQLDSFVCYLHIDNRAFWACTQL